MNIGNWEKHTRGIGSKLLEKFGFNKGKGLGLREDGIAKAIEVDTRQVGTVAGLGFTVTNKQSISATKRGHPRNEYTEDTDEISKISTKKVNPSWMDGLEDSESSWKKTSSSSVKRKKYSEKLAEFKEYESSTFIESKEVIIDMRGKESRVLENYADISDPSLVGSTIIGEELMYNLTKIGDSLYKELMQQRKFLDNITKPIEYQNQDIELYNCEIQENNKKIARLNQISGLLDTLPSHELINDNSHNDKIINDAINSVSKAVAIFSVLYNEYFEEYQVLGLEGLLINEINPQLKLITKHWIPLEDPSILYLIIQSLDSFNDDSRLQDVGTKLLEEIILPHIKRSLINDWNPADSTDESILLLKSLERSFSQDYINMNFISSIIFPKILEYVESIWNPLIDGSCDMIILPWLQLPQMKSSLSTVYPLIRKKLRKNLNNVDLSDSSISNKCISLLLPWKHIFDTNSYNNLIDNTIIPKLIQLIHETLVINPSNQKIDYITILMNFEIVLPTDNFVALIAGELLVKWFNVLIQWLRNSVDVKGEEIVIWYKGWQSMLPMQILQDTFVLKVFNYALDELSFFLSNKNLTTKTCNQVINWEKKFLSYHHIMDYKSKLVKLKIPPVVIDRINPFSQEDGSSQMSLKRMLELDSLAKSIEFLPIQGKLQDGRQVYKYGKFIIYFDGDLIYTQNLQHEWHLASINDVLTQNSVN